MICSQGIELKPNNMQLSYFAQACELARFSYNWPLTEWRRQYTADKSYRDVCTLSDNEDETVLNQSSNNKLAGQFNALKYNYITYLTDIAQCEIQLAVMQLADSGKKFLIEHIHYPQLLKTGWYKRYRLLNSQISIKGKFIRIPNVGWVRLTEPLRYDGKIVSAKVFNRSGRWYVIVAVETGKAVA